MATFVFQSCHHLLGYYWKIPHGEVVWVSEIAELLMVHHLVNFFPKHKCELLWILHSDSAVLKFVQIRWSCQMVMISRLAEKYSFCKFLKVKSDATLSHIYQNELTLHMANTITGNGFVVAPPGLFLHSQAWKERFGFVIAFESFFFSYMVLIPWRSVAKAPWYSLRWNKMPMLWWKEWWSFYL